MLPGMPGGMPYGVPVMPGGMPMLPGYPPMGAGYAPYPGAAGVAPQVAYHGAHGHSPIGRRGGVGAYGGVARQPAAGPEGFS